MSSMASVVSLSVAKKMNLTNVRFMLPSTVLVRRGILFGPSSSGLAAAVGSGLSSSLGSSVGCANNSNSAVLNCSFFATQAANKPLSSEELIQIEEKYGAHNYHPIPCVFSKAKGVEVWDPEGKKYYDFLSAYSAVNQGHCHDKIIKALTTQSSILTLSSRAFYNNVFPIYTEYITKYFGYQRVLPMNSGAEAVETALKLSRKWAYLKKGVKNNEAIIINCTGCFHGRTLGIISMSDDPSAKDGFGPYLPGVQSVEYGDINALRQVLEKHSKNVAAFLIEPIQGEAGIVIPRNGFLKEAYDLCKKHNVLFIADEIQTGLARTGRLLACDWEGVRPDVLILGKALSGGVFPISAVLADDDVMLTIHPGEHGSTFGGSPLSSAVAIAALEVLKEEKLAENAERQGNRLLQYLTELKKEVTFIDTVRGRGLLCAIVIDPKFSKSAWDICIALRDEGLLCKPTHDHIIRLAPPLVINDQQLDDCMKIMGKVLREFQKYAS